jgi:hypothetical protein
MIIIIVAKLDAEGVRRADRRSKGDEKPLPGAGIGRPVRPSPRFARASGTIPASAQPFRFKSDSSVSIFMKLAHQ